MLYLEDLDPSIVEGYLRGFRNNTDRLSVCKRCVYVMQHDDLLFFACPMHYVDSSRRFAMVLYSANWRGGVLYIANSARGIDGRGARFSEFIRSITATAPRTGEEESVYSAAIERAISSKVWGDCSHLCAIANNRAPRIVQIKKSTDSLMALPRIDSLLDIFPSEHFSYNSGENPHLAAHSRAIYHEDRSAISTTVRSKGKTVELSHPIPPYYYMDLFGHNVDAARQDITGETHEDTIIEDLTDEDDDEEHVDEVQADINGEDT